MKTILIVTMLLTNSLGEVYPETKPIVMDDVVECAVMAREVQHVAYERNETIFTSCKPFITREDLGKNKKK